MICEDPVHNLMKVLSPDACGATHTYIYGCVLVNEMPKSARYHIDRANSIVFTSERLPHRMKQPVVATFLR